MTADRKKQVIKGFEDLDVFRKAYRVSLEIHQLTLQMPREEQYGSADEMRVWLRYCLDLGYVGESQWKSWRDEYQVIAKMLTGMRKAWE